MSQSKATRTAGSNGPQLETLLFFPNLDDWRRLEVRVPSPAPDAAVLARFFSPAEIELHAAAVRALGPQKERVPASLP